MSFSSIADFDVAAASRSDLSQADAVAGQKTSNVSWLVVTQVKSHRVVYFTDDPTYQPAMDGDWYYVSPFTGALPDGMSLRNCWRWRFNGMDFVDAGSVKAPPESQTLLENNRQALMDLLARRIDALRKPFEPETLAGAQLRALKAVEARAFLNGELAAPVLLGESAAAYRCGLDEMSHRVLDAEAARLRVLIESEAQRERLAVAIRSASTQEELQELRERILEEVAADRVEPAAFKPKHTTPERMSETLDARTVDMERARLRLQLRNRINDLRRGCASQYLLDDLVTARRVEIAVAVQRAGGALPEGVDGTLLLSHAAARGERLIEAARAVTEEAQSMRQTLMLTEQMKDAMLARISSVMTLEDVRQTGRAIQSLAMPISRASA